MQLGSCWLLLLVPLSSNKSLEGSGDNPLPSSLPCSSSGRECSSWNGTKYFLSFLVALICKNLTVTTAHCSSCLSSCCPWGTGKFQWSAHGNTSVWTILVFTLVLSTTLTATNMLMIHCLLLEVTDYMPGMLTTGRFGGLIAEDCKFRYYLFASWRTLLHN